MGIGAQANFLGKGEPVVQVHLAYLGTSVVPGLVSRWSERNGRRFSVSSQHSGAA